MVSSAQLAAEDVPEIPPTIRTSDLDRRILADLRGLSKEHAEWIALHLASAARLMDSEPELAYRHARTAADRAGRVAVVRETAGIAAYLTGRFAEASRELRTYRRLAGAQEHLPILADCERGLGRPDRAIDLANSPEGRGLRGAEAIEMVIVLAGARSDLGEFDAALALLRRTERSVAEDPEAIASLTEARQRVEALAAGGDRDVIDAPIPIEPLLDEEDDGDVALYDAEEGAW
ncbi:MAG: hypothetical protein FWD59_10660 [Micrococcales bacterium]|nr:hypothetical protein [Micrococcales bacterium]